MTRLCIMSRTNGNAKDDIKMKIIYMDMLCTSKIASDTFETIKKQARNDVTLQIRTEIEWNSAPAQTQGKRTNALKSDQGIYNFMNCHTNAWDQAFFAHLPNISNSVEFAAQLFQLSWRQILVNTIHTIDFGERYCDAYDNQKNYLKNETCKPFGVSGVDKSFRPLDLLCKTLEYFPTPSDIDSTVSTEDWDAFECTKEIPVTAVHQQYKFNLLPEHFQDHIQGLKHDNGQPS